MKPLATAAEAIGLTAAGLLAAGALVIVWLIPTGRGTVL